MENGRRMRVNQRTVEILDTTLRDGVQAAGVIFSLEDKIKLVRALDKLGVSYIEAGNPFSNPKDAELFRFAREGLRLKNARLAAFGMTRRGGMRAEDDAALRALLESGAHIASIVGKASASQARDVVGVTPEENLAMIEDTARFLTSRGMSVFFDAEHFFDGYREDPAYALSTLEAAARGGAARLVLCDTNGGTLPRTVAEVVRAVASRFSVPVAIHCHNDAGLATAGTLAARRGRGHAGAGHRQRLRRALRQRQPLRSAAQPGIENGHTRPAGGFAFPVVRYGALHQRTGQPQHGRKHALCGPQRLRPQGRHAYRRRAQAPRQL